MTYRGIISRIESIALAHKQVRSFFFGLTEDAAAKDRQYPFVQLQGNAGTISTSGHASTFNFRMFFMDLVHVAKDAKNNELDVQSDMISVAMDIIAQMNHGSYSDWRVSADNQLTLLVDETDDIAAGCYVDVTIDVMYKQNTCQIPTNS